MNNSSIKNTSWNIPIKDIPKNRRLMYYLFLISILGCFTYFFLFNPSRIKLPTKQKSTVSWKRKVTIVMNTFNRHQEMEEAVDYYSTCDLVSHIYVVWSEKTPPPEEYTHKYSMQPQPKVTFSIQTEDSLNTRFKPLEGPHTDSIFTVDDDMRVSCQDLGLGYEVWMNSPRTIVGYMPRLHLRNHDGSYQYRCWWRVWWHGAYSIILTKASFVHHDYFHQYSNVMPAKIRSMVDDMWNCEDIAMQFLIANITSLPPIFVRGNLGDHGVFNGISNTGIFANTDVVAAKHMGDRSICINKLVEVYGKNPLVKSHVMINSASNVWSNAPSTWYEYISSDLWRFW